MDSALNVETPSTGTQQFEIGWNSNVIRQSVDWTSNAWMESDFDDSLFLNSEHTTLFVMQDFEPTVLQETVRKKSLALLTPVKNSPTNNYAGISHLNRDFLRPEPLLFRPKTFWRKTRRSALTGPAYSPASHLVRRATFIAAGLHLDTPSPDLTALSVDTRAGSVNTVLIPQADLTWGTAFISTCHGFYLSSPNDLDVPTSRPNYVHTCVAYRDSFPSIVADTNTASDISISSFDYWWPYPPWGASTINSPYPLTVPFTSISSAIQTTTSTTVTESGISFTSLFTNQTSQSSYIIKSPLSSSTPPLLSMSIPTLDFPSSASNTLQDQDLPLSSYPITSKTSSLRIIIPIIFVLGDSVNIAGPRYSDAAGLSSVSCTQGLCEDSDVARYDHFANPPTYMDALENYDLASRNSGLQSEICSSYPVMYQTRAQSERDASMSYENSRVGSRGKRMMEKLRIISDPRRLAHGLNNSEVNERLIQNTLNYETRYSERSNQKSKPLHHASEYSKSARRTDKSGKTFDDRTGLEWCSVPDIAFFDKANAWTNSPVRGLASKQRPGPSPERVGTIASQRICRGSGLRQGYPNSANIELSRYSSSSESNSYAAKISSTMLPSSPPHVNSPLLKDNLFFTSHAFLPCSDSSQPPIVSMPCEHLYEMSEMQHNFRQCNRDYA